MSTIEFPSDRRYTDDHEWAKPQGDEILVGVSAFAVEQLGDITLVSVDVEVGATVEAGKAFGTIESVKTLSDLLAPVTGKVLRINKVLEDQPELINEDCHEKGWIVAIAPLASGELEKLMDSSAYAVHVKNAH